MNINYNDIRDNDSYGVYIDYLYDDDGSQAIVQYNNITGNEEYGVYCYSASTGVDARNNWWGSVTGPTHADNEGGTGDAVSDYVLYDPWLTSPWLGLSVTYRFRPTPAPAVFNVDMEGFADGETFMGEYTGVTLMDVTLTTPDRKSTLTIKSGTELLDGEGQLLSLISVAPVDETAVPAPPDAAIALMYDFGPDGATFNPPLLLSMPLPEGADPDGAVMAYWNGAEWINLPATYDPATGMLRAQVNHFTTFALIVLEEEDEPVSTPTPTPTSTPAATATPTPTPTPTSTDPVITPTTPAPATTAPASPTAPLAWWAILLIVIAAVVVLGTGVWYYRRRQR